jgi:hypothetical protein
MEAVRKGAIIQHIEKRRAPPREERGDLPQSDLEAQAAFAVRVRDDISKLTGLVNELRSVQTQLKARSAVLEGRKSEPAVAELLRESQAAIARAFAIESGGARAVIFAEARIRS